MSKEPQTTDPIKKCPCCNGTASMIIRDGNDRDDGEIKIECGKCGLRTETYGCGNFYCLSAGTNVFKKQDAIRKAAIKEIVKLWNTRNGKY